MTPVHQSLKLNIKTLEDPHLFSVHMDDYFINLTGQNFYLFNMYSSLGGCYMYLPDILYFLEGWVSLYSK